MIFFSADFIFTEIFLIHSRFKSAAIHFLHCFAVKARFTYRVRSNRRLEIQLKVFSVDQSMMTRIGRLLGWSLFVFAAVTAAGRAGVVVGEPLANVLDVTSVAASEII
jgi:hypothetical protein